MKKIITLLLLTVSITLSAQTYKNGYVTERIYDEEGLLVTPNDYGSDVTITVSGDNYKISFTKKNGGTVSYDLTHVKGLKYKDKSGKKYTIDNDLVIRGILDLSDDVYENHQTKVYHFYRLSE